ncbi:hypothetical protein HO173_010344 [Letharia columbiana]|uniref:SAP domain-containing protein n=1 Tax=Letharia columbiana TaxID=112416 RepID=A0A8H6FMS5_9LECA|nr:uncharacterized protein HO173_010344 [Letharia columbiana]KAF6231384.1 hypothetical protein HO173_010344 [Letharia columbiana]
MTSTEIFTAMTCKELKTELRKRDLPTGGLKKDLLDRLREAENATLTDVVNTTTVAGRVEACVEVETVDRRPRRAWVLLCLIIICVGGLFCSRYAILENSSDSVVGDHDAALTPQDLTWLNYPDHYKVLNVSASASSKVIRRAYRQKAKKWHPDKAETMNINQGVLFKATRIIGLSRDILLDPRDRGLYDMGLNPVKCDSSCELCTCSCGYGSRLSSWHPSNWPTELIDI